MPKKPAKPETLPVAAPTKLSLAAPAKVLATLTVVAAVYFAVAWLGRAAGEAVAARPAYQTSFDSIQVTTPPGLDRETFLNEVKYLGSPPKSYSTVDATVRSTLAEAFAKHPWVLNATPTNDGAAPVALRFRTPVLRVAIVGGPERLVDAKGVLLPVTHWPQPLPTFSTPQPAPLSPAGELWLNPHLPTALGFVADYAAWNLTLNDGQWSFTQQGGKRYTMPAKR